MVYVVQEVPGKNILPATRFGELELLLPPGDVVLSPVPTIMKLKAKLQNFCSRDYLLLIGDPIAIGMACMVASMFNKGVVPALKWDRQEKRYYPVAIDLHAVERGELCIP